MDGIRALGQVVHARRDHPQGPGDQLPRAAAPGPVAGHVVHLALVARGQPGGEPRLGLAKVGVGDAQLLEAEFQTPALDEARQGLRRDGASAAGGFRDLAWAGLDWFPGHRLVWAGLGPAL